MKSQRKQLQDLKKESELLKTKLAKHKQEMKEFEEESRQAGLKIQLRMLKNKMGII